MIIIIIATLIFIIGVLIIIKPEIIFGYLRNNRDNLWLHILAVVARLVIGALLLSQYSESKFPLTIEFLGWLSIAAAIILAAIGRRNFKRFMTWALSLLKPYGRIGGVFAAAFGVFLIYAFV